MLQRLGRALLDFVYPPRCFLCGDGGAFLCERCTRGLPRAGLPRCERCWLPLHFGAHRCPLSGSALLCIRSACSYGQGARELVHALKYEGLSVLAEPMGRLLADLSRDHGLTGDALVPVPLHPHRQRSRGYNQAEALANVIGRELGLPVQRALRRTRATAAQIQQRSAQERARNVAGAFAAREPVQGRRLMLVDDVATTGSTLMACASVLDQMGAIQVVALTFARED